jgi:UDP-glucose 4-epimerase
MKVVITGANGFIGTELAGQCAEGHIDAIKIDTTECSEPNYCRVDINSDHIAEYIHEGCDAIIHLAGLSRDGDCRDKGYDTFTINVMGTLNLMEAARKMKVKQFIFASSEWVYDSFRPDEIKDENSMIDIRNIQSEYALSKLVGEMNLRQKYSHGFCPVTILRFGIVYGPREQNWSAVESLFNSVRTKDLITVGSLRTGRCFIHVRDICSAIIESIGLEGFNILNVQGDEFITLKDIIECSKVILNQSPQIIENDPQNISAKNISNRRAKEVLNWQPRYDLKRGLQSLL